MNACPCIGPKCSLPPSVMQPSCWPIKMRVFAKLVCRIGCSVTVPDSKMVNSESDGISQLNRRCPADGQCMHSIPAQLRIKSNDSLVCRPIRCIKWYEFIIKIQDHIDSTQGVGCQCHTMLNRLHCWIYYPILLQVTIFKKADVRVETGRSGNVCSESR